MADKQFTVFLPESWLRLLREVAKRRDLSAGEYVRRMIATDADVLALIAESNLKGLPNISRKWGGRMTAKRRAQIEKERVEPEQPAVGLFGRPVEEEDEQPTS